MLHKDHEDSNIPHQSSLQACILVMWEEYMDRLAGELKVILSTASETCN